MSSIRQGAVIPVYNHGSTTGPIVDFLVEHHIPVIIVDDGSYLKTKAALAKIEKKYPDDVTLLTLPENTGKGAAVMVGIEMAAKLGLTHVLQIDADGQHDINRVIPFFELSAENPDSLICGYPEYDETVPKNRLTGRRITNTMIAIETWGSGIRDGMCGFRVYPVESTLKIRNKLAFPRMGFDIDVLVKLYWSGVPVIDSPVRVTYPEGGTSNFRMVHDNIEISIVHTCLFFGMLLRIPKLISLRKRND